MNAELINGITMGIKGEIHEKHVGKYFVPFLISTEMFPHFPCASPLPRGKYFAAFQVVPF